VTEERKERTVSRFLIGSALLFAGFVLVASAVFTVVGLPLGLIVVGAALELMVGQRHSTCRKGA
jgi:hypothetical protein